ncbi:MAG: histone deacetylase [Flavobacteriaceae bacterium]|jgi:acetoin utilization deacetylase AcuC-like enzyme|tara:strand:- start:253 stop:1155 length:903 start_codon:yes stop_codon:yes gene_type:complete
MLKVAYSKIYNHPLPENHRFPMEKYDLIPKKLIAEKTFSKDNFFEPGILNKEDVLLTHSNDYYNKLVSQSLSKKEIRPIGFPLSKLLIEREKKIAQGTIECVSFSIKNGISMNIAGGTHHAFADKGEGFCMLNDQAIAANYLLHNDLAKKILIIDLDVHQGNGTASIFKNDMNVFTLSFHGKKNYPFKKEKSDLDIEFDDGTEDVEYLTKLEDIIPNIIKILNPDFIFYLSGVDILKTDKLGRLSLSIEGCKKRDSIILNLCKTFNIPLQISMGGGYSKNIEDIVNAHCNTFRLAKEIYF